MLDEKLELPRRTGKLQRLQQMPGIVEPSTVLVVEDSRSLNALLCNFLRRLPQVEVETAFNLAEAAELIATEPSRFFCAALDLHLSDAPKGEIVDLVLAAGVPVVVLTASADAETRKAMLARPIIDYVIKRDVNEIEHVAYLVGRLRENRAVKVLVVEDSPSFRAYVVALLQRYCYQIYEAGDGHQALELLAEHPDVSLVITDVHMPKMNGLELIARIRAIHQRENLAIIGLSQASDPGLISLMLKSGANDFLAKPFEVEHFYCRVTQNTNMVGFVRRIREASIRDYLTGVYNRRHFFEVGRTMHANAVRGNMNIAIALIDADHFKGINDAHGHATGDEVLRRIAQVIQRDLRATDIVARYGGEEFVCLAVISQPDDADLVCERLRRSVERISISDGQNDVRVTVSIGVTTEICESLESMIERADRACYAAKRGGRNQVVRG